MTATAGVICLQGGRELTPPCDDMDRAVLARCSGRIVVLAGAARPGSDYAGASARTVAHYARFGADVEVVADPRDDRDRSFAALDDPVGLIVLPGGSPAGLLDVLAISSEGGPSIGQRLIEHWSAGSAISGASAGAMVLCERTLVPGARGSAAGLGLVAGIAVPHWTPGSERRWPVPDGLVWGLPECGGVLIDADGVIAIGQGTASIRTGGNWTAVDRTAPQALPD